MDGKQLGREYAYPIQASDVPGSFHPQPGMTLRELFAKDAMKGFISKLGTDANSEETADLALMYADALLAKLAKS